MFLTLAHRLSFKSYAGASSDAKKKVLAWLPRVMAFLSFAGSSFIIYDTSKSREARQKVMNQLLLVLSVFDIIGSCAYAFTTLPIPEDWEFGPIYGAHGNEATCVAQGFFIQLGTISAFLNVALAIYYLLVIKYGWTETQLLKRRVYLFLPPIVVGLVFAFAGIPYDDSLMIWCNNGASYWPDIPVAIAIGLATAIMATVCWDVYSKEKASAKWRGGAGAGASNNSRGRQTLSSRVFWQSFWYLMAFYLTWPAYLGLQYSWAGGSNFANYGLVLAGAVMAPLQGFWNMMVYIRPRYLDSAFEAIRRRWNETSTTMATRMSFFKSSRPSHKFSSTGNSNGTGTTGVKSGGTSNAEPVRGDEESKVEE